MWLFGRDYRILTEEEKLEWDKILEREKIIKDGKVLRFKRPLFR